MLQFRLIKKVLANRATVVLITDDRSLELT
jgi:hypothetical protein